MAILIQIIDATAAATQDDDTDRVSVRSLVTYRVLLMGAMFVAKVAYKMLFNMARWRMSLQVLSPPPLQTKNAGWADATFSVNCFRGLPTVSVLWIPGDGLECHSKDQVQQELGRRLSFAAIETPPRSTHALTHTPALLSSPPPIPPISLASQARERLYRQILRQDMGFFEASKAGELSSRLRVRGRCDDLFALIVAAVSIRACEFPNNINLLPSSFFFFPFLWVGDSRSRRESRTYSPTVARRFSTVCAP